ncbi:MAG: hypothetical protein GXY82_11120 [Methanospirillum sp.]|nr:hypothetical protein [Methanospirillum sp.]
MPPHPDRPGGTELPDETLIEVIESIREPAYLVLPGGRIAAFNRAATRLFDRMMDIQTITDLLEKGRARRADGDRLIQSDIPSARALRGEIVSQGERFELTLSGGRVYRTIVTSTPIVLDGKVVAALSVLHDFDEYARRLGDPPTRADPNDPDEGL